jgi:circadian clock protein KaiC
MRVTTGIKKLDRMLGGGFPENSIILVSGGPGTGKTLVSLNFVLEGARKGEKCCYLTLNETREDILRACDSITALNPVKKYLDKNLAIEHIPMSQSNVSMKRFAEIISQYPKIDRIVIDNVNKLLMFSESKKSYRAYLIDILNTLKATKSSLILCETNNDDTLDSGNFEAFECDGVVQLIFLDLEEKPMRALMVHKMRYTAFDPKLPHELRISSKDISLTETKVI